jgi:hypothetical protein
LSKGERKGKESVEESKREGNVGRRVKEKERQVREEGRGL